MTNSISRFSGGGLVYTPAMMQFDATSVYNSASVASGSSGQATLVARFNLASMPASTGAQYIARLTGNTANYAAIILSGGNHADPNIRNCINFIVWDSGSTIVCRLFSDLGVDMTNTDCTVFASYDSTTGNAVMRINGKSEDITHPARVTPVAATLASGSGVSYIGNLGVGEAFPCEGEIGFVGMDDSYLTNWSDFMQADGSPKELDETTWTEWGAQPLFWNHHGDMTNNLGSAGDMTKNGAIEIGTGGNGPHPLLGLNTVGTAATHHIKTAKTSWVDGVQLVGNAYTPAMMQFNGTTGYYSKTGLTTSGNKVSVFIRFNVPPLAGVTQSLFNIYDASTDPRMRIFLYSSDTGDATRRNKLTVQSENGSGTLLCALFSISELADGENHSLFYSFDADAGTAVFIVDGQNEDDTGQAARVAPTTGTLDSGAAFGAYVGYFYSGAAQYCAGSIGAFGYRDDAYLTNWSDFMQADGSPKALDESTWTEWGAQPLFWNEAGDMVNNLGSAGAMTKNGTINVGKGGN